MKKKAYRRPKQNHKSKFHVDFSYKESSMKQSAKCKQRIVSTNHQSSRTTKNQSILLNKHLKLNYIFRPSRILRLSCPMIRESSRIESLIIESDVASFHAEFQALHNQ